MVIVENCFGIKNKHSEAYSAAIEDQILESADIIDGIEIETIGDGSHKSFRDQVGVGEIKRNKRVKAMVKVQMSKQDPEERDEENSNRRKLVEEVLERARRDPTGTTVDFVLDEKVDVVLRDGAPFEVFTVSVIVEGLEVNRVKRGITEIRDFDRTVRRQVEYTIPSLATMSRTF